MTKRFSDARWRVMVPYTVVAVAWAFVSHYFLNLFSPDWQHFAIDVGDDLALAAVTVGLLYLLLRREKRVREEADALRLQSQAEREKLVARLDEERARLATVLEQMPVGVILAEAPSGRITLHNQQIVAVLGHPFSPRPRGQRHTTPREPCLPGPPDDLAQELLEQTMETGRAVTDEDLRFARPDGVCATIRMSVVPVCDAGGQTAGVVATFSDITDRQQAEEALRRARDELERRVQERTASLREATEKLERYNESLEQRVTERTKELYREAQRTAGLEERQRLARELHDSVSQALYGIGLGVHAALEMLGRPDGKIVETLNYVLLLAEGSLSEMRALILELRPESLERQGLVAALTTQGLATQARYSIAVSMDLGDEPEAALVAKEALYRVAQQALHNIVQHARAGRASISLGIEGSDVVLEVRDNGVGFDPHGPFHDRIGLHSMHERTERLGGRLEVESAPGQGTVVRAKVPASPFDQA